MTYIPLEAKALIVKDQKRIITTHIQTLGTRMIT